MCENSRKILLVRFRIAKDGSSASILQWKKNSILRKHEDIKE